MVGSVLEVGCGTVEHVTQMELLGTFERGRDVRIQETALETRLEQGEVHAWLARVRRG